MPNAPQEQGGPQGDKLDLAVLVVVGAIVVMGAIIVGSLAAGLIYR